TSERLRIASPSRLQNKRCEVVDYSLRTSGDSSYRRQVVGTYQTCMQRAESPRFIGWSGRIVQAKGAIRRPVAARRPPPHGVAGGGGEAPPPRAGPPGAGAPPPAAHTHRLAAP